MSEPKNIKDFLSLAKIEPIRIKNLEGESFILMSEKHYQKILEEALVLKSKIETLEKLNLKPSSNRSRKNNKIIKKNTNKKRRKK